jgi:hypothetical protein
MSPLVEGRRSVSGEGRPALDYAMRKRESEVWNEKLLDVGATDICGLCNLCNSEDLLEDRYSA